MVNKLRLKIEPLDKPRTWVLLEEINYKGIIVPKGFVFDGASIPLGLRWRFPHGGRKMYGACVHDWLYRTHESSRKEADKLFLEAMLENGEKPWDARLMYLGVKYGGKSPWENPIPVTIIEV